MTSALGRLRWGLQVLAWLVALAAVAALVVAVLVPRLAGATPYTVLTGSMRPGLPEGTLVVVRPIDPDEISVGDVITYQLHSGQPEVVTHRVVAQGHTVTGELRLQTQGDANDVPDAASVRPVQVRGKLWYSVPELGRANAILSGHQRQLGVYLVAGMLVLYALGMWVGALRDRRRPRKEVSLDGVDITA